MLNKEVPTFKTGATFCLVGSIYIPDLSQPNAYLNLTGWTAQAKLKRKDNYKLISNLNVIIGTSTNNKDYAIQLTANDTSNWDICLAITDIKFTSPNGEITTISDSLTINIINNITD